LLKRKQWWSCSVNNPVYKIFRYLYYTCYLVTYTTRGWGSYVEFPLGFFFTIQKSENVFIKHKYFFIIPPSWIRNVCVCHCVIRNIYLIFDYRNIDYNKFIGVEDYLCDERFKKIFWCYLNNITYIIDIKSIVITVSRFTL